MYHVALPFQSVLGQGNRQFTTQTRPAMPIPSAKYLTTIDTEFWLPGHNETSAPISTFWQRVRHLSHPEYPFLDPVYSPRSCVPCADFTAFIADRLRNDDVASVCDLVQLVMTECLGIGTGSGWVEQAIKEMYANIGELARLDLSPYCHANNPNFEWELKSMFVMWPREKERRGYLLANGRFSLLSSAMCCYDIHWSKRVSELRERANRFIIENRVDAPHWVDYPLCSEAETKFPEVNEHVVSVIATLPPLSRVQLLAFAARGNASLTRNITFNMRGLGINPIETVASLLACGLCEPTMDIEALARVFSKAELFAVMEQESVQYRKSWTKRQLLNTLAKLAPDLVTRISNQEKVVQIKAEYVSDLCALQRYAAELQDQIKLLCFVGAPS